MHGTIVSPEPSRVVRRHNDWTLKEHEVVVSHWPDIGEIARRLPHRTRGAIQGFGRKCNLGKPVHVWTAAEDAHLRRRIREGVSRQVIANELKMNLNQVANRMAYIKLRCGPKPVKPTGNRLMDAVFARAFELNLKRKDLDEICRSGEVFRRWSPARKIAIRHVITAVRFMEGDLAVEWRPLGGHSRKLAPKGDT
jgi:hypothetical protein